MQAQKAHKLCNNVLTLYDRVTGSCSNTTLILFVSGHPDVAILSPGLAPTVGNKRKHCVHTVQTEVFSCKEKKP